MTAILIANNITSFLIIVSAWWLAHIVSAKRERYWASVTVAYASIGLISSAIALFRNINVDFPWLPVAGKAAIAALFILTISKRHAQILGSKETKDQ